MKMGYDAVWVALSKLLSSAWVRWGLRNTRSGLVIYSIFLSQVSKATRIAGNQ